jgi:hypothetical protein
MRRCRGRYPGPHLLSLSGIVLTASPAILSASKNAVANLMPVVPTAQRRFARTDRVTAFVRIYQAAGKPAQPASLTARIVDIKDSVLLNEVETLTAERFADNNGADYRINLPAERLGSGEYLLTIETSQGKQTARRGVRFTVQ